MGNAIVSNIAQVNLAAPWMDTVNAAVVTVQRAVANASNGVFTEWSSGLGGAVAAGIASARKDYPDIAWSVRAAVANGNLVSFQYVAKGTNAATGRVVSWTGSVIANVEGGQITKLVKWEEDGLVRNLQLGNVPKVGVGGITGQWVGATVGVGFVASLQHAPSGEVWGTVDVANVGKFTGTGSVNGSTFTFTATDPGGRTVNFSGQINGGQILGQATGNNEAITLHRAS